MKRLALSLALSLPLLFGCRREDWRSVELELPQGIAEARAVEALSALDRLTPPKVARRGRTLVIRYNAMRVAPGNFAYALGRLAAGEAKEGAR